MISTYDLTLLGSLVTAGGLALLRQGSGRISVSIGVQVASARLSCRRSIGTSMHGRPHWPARDG